MSQDFWRSAPPRGFDQIPGSLGSDAGVQICEFTDLRRIIWQIGQLVQHDVRFELTKRLDKCLPANLARGDSMPRGLTDAGAVVLYMG